jgi:L-threonylcarbamoyladenylate synthase
VTDLTGAVAWLKSDGIVAFPTDTLYGLAVNPASPVAVQHLFDLKGRESRAALPLIAASATQVEACCGGLGPTGLKLAARFWPGPLSLIVDAPASIAADVHGGLGSVAVRVPANPIAVALCDAFGGLLTATSANRSGEPPASDARALGAIAGDPRVMVIDAGPTAGGRPSTIVDARAGAPVLVREGAIAWDRVLKSLQE